MARGSIRKLDGAWGFRIDLGPDPATGKRRQVSKQGFTTKRDAEAALRELSQSVDKGTLAKRSMRTLGDYLDEWHELQEDRLRADHVAQLRDRDRSDQAAARPIEAAGARTTRARAVLRLPARRGRTVRQRPVAEDGPQHPHGVAQGAVRCRTPGPRRAERGGVGAGAVRRPDRVPDVVVRRAAHVPRRRSRSSPVRGVRVVDDDGHASR